MPRVSAFDGKRQINASKAISERQPTSPEARASSCVGCLLVAGRQPAIQSAGALLADGQGRGGGRSFRHSTAGQQREFSHKLNRRGVHRTAPRKISVSSNHDPRIVIANSPPADARPSPRRSSDACHRRCEAGRLLPPPHEGARSPTAPCP